MIVDFGAYLGEVLCRHLPARWLMDPAGPQAVIAARVIDTQNRRINPFAQIGARFRDGAGFGMHSMWLALGGRPAVAANTSVRVVPAAARPVPIPVAATGAAPAPPPQLDSQQFLRTAELQAASGQTAAAIASYRQVLALDPAQHEARRQLAIGLGFNGDLAGALLELDELKRQRPQDPAVADLRALLLAHAGRFDEAVGTLEMALMRAPGEAGLLRRRAFVRLKAGQFARAQAELEKLIDQHPDDAELRIGLAQAHEQQGQLEAACRMLQAVLAQPDVAERFAAAARERLALLTRAPAPAATSPPVADRPAGAFAYEAAVSHARAGRFNEALPLFIEAARLSPERLAYVRDVGNCLNDLGRPAESRDWLMRAHQLDPGNGQVRWLLGVVAEKLADHAEALRRYREILADTRSDQHYVNKAFDRLQRLGGLP